MTQPFEAIKVTERVYWVGAVDWAIRDFHGYYTDRGSTYNAYLILADKVTLIDTVKAPFKDEMFARIASVIPPCEIDYIISNHAEMDHSGCLASAIETIQPEKVFASTMGVKALAEHFHFDHEIIPLKEGDTLNLGNLNLSFLETRMLHWPDSMVTYLAEDQLLFSQDGFGMHLASGERFADQIPESILESEAATYFANILLLYAPLITKLLGRIKDLGIPIRVIAPDHGPIWRQDLGKILGWYAKWAEQKPTNKAVILYDTMWGSTEMMARSIADGLSSVGVSVKECSLRECHRSEAPTEILCAGALLVGSPTLNNGIFPTVADNLTYLKGLKPKNLIGAAFGSYGWSGEAVGIIEDLLREMKVELVSDGIKSKFVPDGALLSKCREFGVSLGQILKDRLSAK